MKGKNILKGTTAVLVGIIATFSIAAADHGAVHPPEEHPSAACSTDFLKAGFNDAFDPVNVDPAPSSSSNLQTILNNYLGGTRDFDDLSSNKVFGHTFTGLPSGIVAATLNVHLQARPDIPTNDAIHIEIVSMQLSSFIWGSHLSALPEAGGTWNVGQDAWFTLDLSALPNADGSFTNALPSINSDQALDVYIQDDTAVDVLILTITHCPTAVDIDIKPASDPNSINLKNKGTIPVAILGSSIDVTTIDQSSVRFGPASAEPVANKKSLEDVDGDGKLDLVLHFKAQETGIEKGDTEAALTGKTVDGVDFSGTDAIRTVPAN